MNRTLTGAELEALKWARAEAVIRAAAKYWYGHHHYCEKAPMIHNKDAKCTCGREELEAALKELKR